MNSKSEYQTIPVGPAEVTFKPENQGRSRFLSLIHLTLPKAVVLATTIVCVTFAAFHFDRHTQHQGGIESAYYSTFPGSEQIAAAVPRPFLRSRGTSCEYLRDDMKGCFSSPAHYLKCQTCGVFRQNLQPAAAPIAAVQRASPGQNVDGGFVDPGLLQRPRTLTCEDLKRNIGYCFVYDPPVNRLCEKCGLRSGFRLN